MLIHFILPVAEYVYRFRFYCCRPRAETYCFRNNGLAIQKHSMFFNNIAIAASGVWYVILSRRCVAQTPAIYCVGVLLHGKINLQWLPIPNLLVGHHLDFVIIGNDVLVFSAAVLLLYPFIGFGIRQSRHIPQLRVEASGSTAKCRFDEYNWIENEIADEIIAKRNTTNQD